MRKGKTKPNRGYESRVAQSLDDMGYDYRCHAKFVASNGSSILVDFLVNEDMVIEVDGPEHNSFGNTLYDTWKMDELEIIGVRVFRISHMEIDDYGCDVVIHRIMSAYNKSNVSKYETSRIYGRFETSYDLDNHYRLSVLYRSIVSGIRIILHSKTRIRIQLRVDYYNDGSVSSVSFDSDDQKFNF